jgi:hypothetical protein
MNDETRRTKSINRWKSCLFNITTQRTDDGRAAAYAIGDWIHTVSFEQFSKPFYRMFQFYSILAMNNIIRSTSLEERDDRHYSANETSKQDSSLDRNNGRCLVSNMKRYDDESSEHTSSLWSTPIIVDETLSSRCVQTSLSYSILDIQCRPNLHHPQPKSKIDRRAI